MNVYSDNFEKSLDFSDNTSEYFSRGTVGIPDFDKNVFLCIGSDKIVFDCLGPLVGSLLMKNKDFRGFVYGTMNCPVTALQVETAIKFIRRFHFAATVTVIDSAVGRREDVGKIKYYERGLRPALGMDKQMAVVGDKSIMGIVSTKEGVRDIYNTGVKLKDVYSMAEEIAESIILGTQEKYRVFSDDECDSRAVYRN